MSFDIEPDGDPHGECSLEIKKLQATIKEMDDELKGMALKLIDNDMPIAKLNIEIAKLKADNDYLNRQLADERSGSCDDSLAKHLRREVNRLEATLLRIKPLIKPFINLSCGFPESNISVYPAQEALTAIDKALEKI